MGIIVQSQNIWLVILKGLQVSVYSIKGKTGAGGEANVWSFKTLLLWLTILQFSLSGFIWTGLRVSQRVGLADFNYNDQFGEELAFGGEALIKRVA